MTTYTISIKRLTFERVVFHHDDNPPRSCTGEDKTLYWRSSRNRDYHVKCFRTGPGRRIDRVYNVAMGILDQVRFSNRQGTL